MSVSEGVGLLKVVDETVRLGTALLLSVDLGKSVRRKCGCDGGGLSLWSEKGNGLVVVAMETGTEVDILLPVERGKALTCLFVGH